MALLRGPQTLWRYNFGPGEAKPSFHPVALPGGAALTGYRPADHRWHRGLWFSWKFINGVNYWEEHPVTGASQGRTVQEPPEIEARPDFSARLRQRLSYRPAGGAPVLREERRIEVHPPQADGSLVFDWDLQFEALTPVVLDRTPPPAGGGPGGYAGLSLRLARDLEEVAVVTTEEAEVVWRRERFWGRAAGLEYQGRLGRQRLGVAVLDHPDNPRSPSPWYAIHSREVHFFTPAVLFEAPHRLEPGETFRLRYRVLVHPEAWDQARLRAAVAEWTAR